MNWLPHSQQLLLAGLSALFLVACGAEELPQPPPDTPFETKIVSGFVNPESAHWHASTRTWFVSNVVGQGMMIGGTTDGEGWITRLTEDGEIMSQKWYSDLNDPLGLTSNNDTLFVVDTGRLVAIDIASASLKEEWPVANAVFLNDSAYAPDGSIYVSDSFAQAIYKFTSGQPAELFVQNPMLDFPNGLNVRGNKLIVASSGKFDDFVIEAPVFEIDLQSKAIQTIPMLSGKFDGVEQAGDGLVLTDFRGKLIHMGADGVPQVVRDIVKTDGFMASADLGYDALRRIALVPDLFGDKVVLYQIPAQP